MVTNPSIHAGPSSCAEATSAKEAGFRIDYALAAARNTRVIAFDEQAASVVRAASDMEWNAAQFFTTTDPGDVLVSMAGEHVPLVDSISESNALVMVSVTGANAAAMAHIGEASYRRGIMTAGLAMIDRGIESDALNHLRPHARILLVPAEPDDLTELLRATRA